MNQDQEPEFNAFREIAGKCGLSERTIRTAFSRKPITYRTARRIATRLGIRIACFVIKEDRRGRGKRKISE